MNIIFNILNLSFIGFVALFPPVNPIGTALIMDPLLAHLTSSQRIIAAKKIAIYSFMICAVATILGSWIFKLFGISIPVVQIAGGILICKMGWQLLSSNNDVKPTEETKSPDTDTDMDSVNKILFYPLSFPMTTGAGTISVLLTLSAHGNAKKISAYFINLGALIFAVLLMAILIFLSYAYTPILIKKLGEKGGQIVNRLSAFLVFCVGLQIATSGIMHLIHPE
ncbi:MarC family protein [Hydrotalea sp.]|uniref:MarC family protein n=1 Tax=Hydrotalea sp. TaxID=2881279 RepID=UPI003D131BEB